MRVFIAADINNQCSEAVASLQQQLDKKVTPKKGGLKWVKTDLMHLTLNFLGEIKDSQVVEVCKTVEKALSGHKSFELELCKVGSFGGSAPGVFWIGSEAGSEQVCRMQQDITDELEKIGFAPDNREFMPHLTLCRVKNSKVARRLKEVAQEYKDYKIGTTDVDSVCVYQSEPTPKGPIYAVLKKIKLN
ncbi:MAG: RNA 2',3'-cyclic phosphodiesterase [Phycisphaerae bacterium]|nr:RNA 2',3'-cyclic phosphodiesterase [Phycisphaerae bacterium]